MQRARPEVSAATAAVVERRPPRTSTTATPTRARWSPTSRRCWRSRPPGPARRPARSRRCCGRCPARPAARPVPDAPPGAWVVLAGWSRVIARSVVLPRPTGAPRHGQAPDAASHASRRCSSATPAPTTTTRTAPAQKTATRSATSSTATPTPPGAPSSTTTAPQEAGGVGLGVYLDAAPQSARQGARDPDAHARVRRAGLRRRSHRTGLPYGSSTPLSARGLAGDRWARARTSGGGERIPLTLDGRPHRYYLVWLTTLPPGMQSATIAELTLFK